MEPARDAEAPDADGLLSIGRLAELSGVSSRTIRYYEELDILPVPERSPGGTRKYPQAYRFYIEGALALKELGFSLDEIRLVGRLALGNQTGDGEGAHAAHIVAEKMRALEHRIRVLSRLREVLIAQHQNAVMERIADLIDMARDDGSPPAS